MNTIEHAENVVEIVQYNDVRAEVNALKELNRNLAFAYETPDGNKNARSHIFKMRQKKADVERVRKAAKADALEYGRKVDAVAEELKDELEAMIAVHQKPINEIEEREARRLAEEERIAAEAKAEAERIERARQQAIIDAERVEAARVATEFAEFRRQQEIERIRREAADNARAQAEAKAKSEADAAAARERAAIESANRAEREKQEAIIAAERAKVEAERQKVEAEKRAIQAAADAAAKAKADQAEAVRLAVVEQARKEQEARDAADKKAKAKADAEAAKLKTKAVRSALIKEIAESIINNTGHVIGVSPHISEQIAEAIADGKISRVYAR